MDREIHPTPRHLDEPLRILGLTASQLVVAVIGGGISILCLTYLPAWVSMSLRLIIAIVLGGLPFMGVTMAAYGGVTPGHVARRLWRYSREASEYRPGPATTGPFILELHDSQTEAQDPHDE